MACAPAIAGAVHAMALAFCAFTGAEARIPALEDDSLSAEAAGPGRDSGPKVYLWAASAAGPMYSSVRSDIGGWMLSSFALSAAGGSGWLMTLRFPELGFPPPTPLGTDAPDVQQDSLLGFSVLAGKRVRWSHGHLSLAAGLNHARGVRIRSHDTCTALFSGCMQIVERKDRFAGFGPVLRFEALTGWRYFGLGAGAEVLGTRQQSWGWHLVLATGRVF